MPATRRYVPRHISQGLGPALSLALRILMAGIATVVLVGIGSSAMLLNTAPAWLSLVFEPLSLLLVPGLLVAAVASSPHDLDPQVIMDASIAFYFALFFFLFELRAWRRRKRLRRSALPDR